MSAEVVRPLVKQALVHYNSNFFFYILISSQIVKTTSLLKRFIKAERSECAASLCLPCKSVLVKVIVYYLEFLCSKDEELVNRVALCHI